MVFPRKKETVQKKKKRKLAAAFLHHPLLLHHSRLSFLDESDSCFNGTLTLVQWKSPVEIKQNGRIAFLAGGNDQPDALICFLPLSVNNTWTKKTFFGGLSWLFILRRPRFQEPNQKLTMVLNCATCY